MEPAGYSSSQKVTKFRLAARSTGSASGTVMNTISFPRDCSLRASAVIGFRCPNSGRLRKPIFIVDPFLELTVPRIQLGRSCELKHGLKVHIPAAGGRDGSRFGHPSEKFSAIRVGLSISPPQNRLICGGWKMTTGDVVV